jgi:hypothetical protein
MRVSLDRIAIPLDVRATWTMTSFARDPELGDARIECVVRSLAAGLPRDGMAGDAVRVPRGRWKLAIGRPEKSVLSRGTLLRERATRTEECRARRDAHQQPSTPARDANPW